MSTRKPRTARVKSRNTRLAIVVSGAIGLAVILTGIYMWVDRPTMSSAPAANLIPARTKGDTRAPVMIEEWGDFQ